MGKIETETLRQKFNKDSLRGRHFFTVAAELNKVFLEECHKERRSPADMIRIILEDRYAEVRYPKTVEGHGHGSENIPKREVA